MGTGFQNLKVWQAAKVLAVDIYRATDNMRDLSLRDQMRRAAVSIPSNIAEGDERDTDKDSVRCFYIAKGSLAELSTQIQIAMEVGVLPPIAANDLLDTSETIGKQLGALIRARSKSSS